jgi:protein TonB
VAYLALDKAERRDVMKTRTRNIDVSKSFHDDLKNTLKANDLLHKRKTPPIERADYEDLLKIKEQRSEKQKKYGMLIFNIGMTISLFLVILAFNWKIYDRGDLVDLGELDPDFEEIIEIPISEQPPPPPPSKVPDAFTIKEVENEEMIEEIEMNLDIDVSADQKMEEIEYTVPVEELPEETTEEIFTIVEQQPEPEGGFEAFNAYVKEKLRYPKQASRLDVSGMVFVQFVVEKDGSITDAVVVKGIGAGCDEEALRVINNSPKWKPGKQRGKPVRVFKIIPIRFVLKN